MQFGNLNGEMPFLFGNNQMTNRKRKSTDEMERLIKKEKEDSRATFANNKSKLHGLFKEVNSDFRKYNLMKMESDEKEIADLKQEVANLNRSLQESKMNNEAKDQENEYIREIKTDLENDNATLGNLLEEKESMAESLLKELSVLKREAEIMQREREIMRDEYEKSKAEKIILKKSLQESREENLKIAGENRAMKDELAVLKNEAERVGNRNENRPMVRVVPVVVANVPRVVAPRVQLPERQPGSMPLMMFPGIRELAPRRGATQETAIVIE